MCFFQVRGGFLCEHQVSTIATNNRIGEETKEQEEEVVTAKLFEPISTTSNNTLNLQKHVNTSQLHQSRLGLISQAFMLFIVGGFLFSETLSDIWKTK